MPSASFGSGLPPKAPMSPPAQLTRISTRPSLASISSFIFATAALSPMLPLTAATLPPWRAICFATASRSGASPYLAGAVQDRSWIARSAPSSARRSAIARPSPRPDPVTKAILPASSLVMPLIPLFRPKSDGAHIRGAPADHFEFIALDCGVLAALPRRAIIGPVREAVDPRSREACGKLRRSLGRVADPPLGSEQPYVAGLERAGLEHSRKLGMMRGQRVEHRGKGNRAFADCAPNQTVAFVREQHAIILEMDVPDMRRDPTDEVERRLGHRKGVAGVEANPYAARLVTKGDELSAAKILMIFDSKNPAFVKGARPAIGKRRSNAGDELCPFVAERVAIAAEHRRQTVADDAGVENSSRAQRAFERTHHQARADDGRQPKRG